MYIKKSYPIRRIFEFTLLPAIVCGLWAFLLVYMFDYYSIKAIAVPFLPISILGIAVSFYTGFKNNVSNARLTEGRTNWGGITNDSRALIALINAYLPESCTTEKEIILKRHIAWLYLHQFFLRHKRMPWEHDMWFLENYRKRYHRDFNMNLNVEDDIRNYISKEELDDVLKAPNNASRILYIQFQYIKQLKNDEVIDTQTMFRLEEHLTRFYDHQGKNERLKTFPLPRQYANFSFLFLLLFLCLFPMGLLSEMQKSNTIWYTIPFSFLVSWVYILMEIAGDFSENPFECLIMDVPILAITRNIEIEILHSLGEPNIPQPIVPVNNVLM